MPAGADGSRGCQAAVDFAFARAGLWEDPRNALTASRDAQIVVGSRGRGGFKGMTLGTVSQAVLQYAPCPVAVIHPA